MPDHKRFAVATFWALFLTAMAAVLNSAHASGTVTNCTEAALQTALIGGGHVLLSCDSSIALTRTIVVAKETILDGTGHTVSLTGGQISGLSRMFQVQPGARLTLRHVTISGSEIIASNIVNGIDGDSAVGAAIYNDRGVVIVDGCVISDHRVAGAAGVVSRNTSGAGGTGGAGLGAAVYNFGGQLIVTNTVFSGNRAAGGAGGPGGDGAVFATTSEGGRGGNGGDGAGAAIYNAGHGLITVTDSLFSNNSVAGSTAGLGGAGRGVLGLSGKPGNPGIAGGAAVFNESGTVTLVNTTYSGNSGAGASGAALTFGEGEFRGATGEAGGAALGAGVVNLANLSATNCTFVQNVLTGGAGGPGGIGRSIGFGDDGGDGGSGGAALGGGLYADGASTTWIVNCTFSDNILQGGSGGSGGAATGVGDQGSQGKSGTESGAAIYRAQGTIRLRNSILAHSTFGGNAGGAINDDGFNLSSDSTPVLSAQGSRNQVDPLLGELVTAGGLVPVLTLASNSPAIDAIVASNGNGCPPFDQRNAARIDRCDIGAYEFGSAVTALQMQMQNGEVVLSWPDSEHYVLQRNTTLSGAAAWTVVTDTPRTASGVNSLTVTGTNQTAFFRLSRQ